MKSGPPEPDPNLVPADQDPYRFRTGRIALVVECALLIAIGGWGLAANAATSPPTGGPLSWLHVTVLHAVVLLGTGVLGMASSAGRRWTLTFTIAQSVAYLALFVAGLISQATGATTAFGFDTAGNVLHGAVWIFGMSLAMWLAATTLEGRWWVRVGKTDRSHNRSDVERGHTEVDGPQDGS